MNPSNAASNLYEALLAEAEQWACDETEDQELLDTIDHARTPHDKLALLQTSSLVPSHLASAVTDVLLVLDPATYSPGPAPTPPEALMPDPDLHRIRDASITVVNASPENNAPSDVYEIQVHGISVLIRRHAQWGALTDVPYVHIDGPGLLLVEVNNASTRAPRPTEPQHEP
ncbi:MAG: hypothetical protein LBV60_19015 [Streptomyces sp.]|jgi:hypothetical protein|nr:hypothetical protein [Streptomyces sp.]